MAYVRDCILDCFVPDHSVWANPAFRHRLSTCKTDTLVRPFDFASCEIRAKKYSVQCQIHERRTGVSAPHDWIVAICAPRLVFRISPVPTPPTSRKPRDVGTRLVDG